MKLNPAESWAKNELLPFLKKGERTLGASVDKLCHVLIVRRLAQNGADLDEILEEVDYHYNHQINFIKKNRN